MKTPSKTTSLYALLEGLQLIREETKYPDIQTQTVVAFLVVATHGEMPMAGLAKHMKTTTASVSRNMAVLANGSKGKPGLELVETWEDPMDRRFKTVRLTARGKALATLLADKVGKVIVPVSKEEA